jgi:hypothetical protein
VAVRGGADRDGQRAALDADNPLTNGGLTLVTAAQDVKNRRPLRPVDEPKPEPDDEPEEPAATGDTPAPAGDPEEGAYADGEEVATPEAATADKPARRRRAPVATG